MKSMNNTKTREGIAGKRVFPGWGAAAVAGSRSEGPESWWDRRTGAEMDGFTGAAVRRLAEADGERTMVGEVGEVPYEERMTDLNLSTLEDVVTLNLDALTQETE